MDFYQDSKYSWTAGLFFQSQTRRNNKKERGEDLRNLNKKGRLRSVWTCVSMGSCGQELQEAKFRRKL